MLICNAISRSSPWPSASSGEQKVKPGLGRPVYRLENKDTIEPWAMKPKRIEQSPKENYHKENCKQTYGRPKTFISEGHNEGLTHQNRKYIHAYTHMHHIHTIFLFCVRRFWRKKGNKARSQCSSGNKARNQRSSGIKPAINTVRE